MVMKTWSGWLDWGLLAVALAVSGYFFWGWWSKGSGVNVLKRPQEMTVTETISAFPEKRAAESSGLVNPLAAPQQPSDAALPDRSRVPQTAPAPEKGAAPQASVAGPVQVSAPVQVQPSAAAPVQAPVPQAAALEAADPFWTDAFSRDPTLSPREIARMIEARKKKAVKPVVDLSLENRLEVQGTVQSRRGVAAIINGERKSIGDKVLGAVVVGIDENAVVFEYKGRRFTKKIGK